MEDAINQFLEYYQDKEVVHQILDEFYQCWILSGHYKGLTPEVMLNYTNVYIFMKAMIRAMKQIEQPADAS